MLRFATDIIEHRHLLLSRLSTDIKGSLAGTQLGYLWLLIDPILLATVYYFVVDVIFERGGPGFFLFVLVGLWPWTWFTRSISQAALTLHRNRGLILSVNVPLSLIVLSPILLNGVFSAIGLVVTLFFVSGFQLVGLVYALVPTAVLFFLICALGTFLAILTSLLRDVGRLLDYGLRLMFFMSPILYDVTRVSESQRIPAVVKEIYFFNPLTHVLPSYREALLDGTFGWRAEFIPIVLLSLALLQLSIWLLRHKKNMIIERL